VPWHGLVAEGQDGTQGVVLCRRGELARAYAVRGWDGTGEPPDVLGARALQANQAVQRLPGTWALHAEARHTRLAGLPTPQARCAAYGQLLATWQAELTHPQRGAWPTDYYLTLVWTPTGASRDVRRRFLAAADGFLVQLRAVLAETEPLTDSALTTYLHSLVSCRWHPVAPPPPRTDLARYLCDSAWHVGTHPAWDSTLGAAHVRLLTLTGYPQRSVVGLMRRLERLRCPYRWLTYWEGLAVEQQDTVLEEHQKDWLGREKKIHQRGVEHIGERETRIINEDARRKAEELSAIRQEVGAGLYGLGTFSTTLVTWADTAEQADTQADQVRQTLEGLGCVVRREGEYGSLTPVASWLHAWVAPPPLTAVFLGTLPGNGRENVRRSLQSSLALIHLLPGFPASWPGPTTDQTLRAGPWFHAKTPAGALVRVVHHIGTTEGVGHLMALGATGSGKSTFIGLGMLHWLTQYAHTQGRILDVGRSQRLVTLLGGGAWIDLAQGGLQPLRHIDDAAEARWALGWLTDCCTRAGVVEQDGLVHQYLSERLAELALLSPDQRTLSALLHACEAHSARVEPHAYKRRDIHGLAQADERLLTRLALHRAIQRALRPFCAGGAYGGMLDGVSEREATGLLVTFELGGVLQDAALLAAISAYAFHRIARAFDTRHPMWLVVEEAPLLALLPQFKGQIEAWLMTIRKAGASLALVVNSLQQALAMGLGLLTDENTPSRYFFPNLRATNAISGAAYDAFGLNEAEKQLIATAPDHHVYYVSPHGRHLLDLRLPPPLLACLARNRDEDHALMDQLLAQEGPEGFAAAWFRHHGLDTPQEEMVCADSFLLDSSVAGS
jgi:type IV secretion system protein VirB4